MGDPEEPVRVRGTGTEPGIGCGGDDFNSTKLIEADTEEERGMAGGLGGETTGPGPSPCPEGRLLELDSAILCLVVRV